MDGWLMRDRLKSMVPAGALLCGALVAATAWACSVPVFRYALERWPGEPYTVYVFHRGPLGDAATKAVDRFREETAANTYGGLALLGVVDVAGEVPERVAKVWEKHSSAALPHVVVRFPEFYGIPIDVWSGPLTDATVTQVLDSPVRRKVAHRVLGGDSAVFVLLESGDAKQDDAAERLLGAELKAMQEAIEVPAPPGGMWDDPIYDADGPPQLAVKFSVLRMKRDDPAEVVLLNMLLGTEPDLHELTEPMVFPIFGRGRALCALVGKGINKENLEEICVFLVGPCSCIVKYQNPGVDLFFTVDWDAALMGEESAIPDITPPALAGFSDFVPKQVSGDADGDGEAPSMLWHVGLAVVGGLVIVAAVGILMWRKAQSAER